MPSNNSTFEQLVAAVEQLAARVRHLETAENSGGITPSDHATSHQNGGSDEISVAGLSGVLADRQDANKLHGRDVDSTAPTNLQVLQWIAASSKYVPTSLSDPVINVGVARASSGLTLSNSWQDVPGCTKTVTFESGDLLLVWTVFDFEMQYSSSTNDLMGALYFNTTRQSQYAHFEGGGPGERGAVSQIYIINPGTGSKTFKLQAARTTTGTGDWCKITHTSMMWMRAKIFTDES